MGTCYSKSGHDAAESNTRSPPIPKDSAGGRHQPNGSLYVYKPVKDQSGQPASASQSSAVSGQEKGEEVKINTIDSGIESLISSQCNKETKELAENSELREATDTFELIDNGPCACGENCEVNGHCKFEYLTKLPESNVDWTTASRSSAAKLPPQPRRPYETSVIHRKPKCKGRIERKSSRLSWKSTDSLDWTRTMVTSMDRATSQVSDIFVDDVSLHAPLAHFDSIEFSGEDRDGDSVSISKYGPKSTTAANDSNVDISSTNCSSSVLPGNQRCMSVCEKNIENKDRFSVQSTDNILLATRESKLQDLVKKQLSNQSLLGSREGDSSSTAGSLLCLPANSEVTSFVVDGKEHIPFPSMNIDVLRRRKTMDTNYSYERGSLSGVPALMNSDDQLLTVSPPSERLSTASFDMAPYSPEMSHIKDCPTEIPEPAPPETPAGEFSPTTISSNTVTESTTVADSLHAASSSSQETKTTNT
ncbi:uncharacterized protein LOC106879466 isoform X7 [Octopus bimaculoides]|uniref:uncharacterized protein LOC106879466 isoform X7 n=1 Tax=Octopus bimaculoides TaxID=37653 RepID=UPI00071D548D|nr:uncharacterized protein LOC106879466 isoform X7 [Octopus bimaculoides]|eukprot:XP_014784526.1 PREDICTED: uncharacterized protein LOC106879466 isoform X7 [Octopus bimaculoides]